MTDRFDIASRRIGGKVFDIFLDDMGLHRENPRPSAVDELGQVMLVGNLFICDSNEDGETISITPEDVDLITQNIRLAVDEEGNPIPILQAGY